MRGFCIRLNLARGKGAGRLCFRADWFLRDISPTSYSYFATCICAHTRELHYYNIYCTHRVCARDPSEVRILISSKSCFRTKRARTPAAELRWQIRLWADLYDGLKRAERSSSEWLFLIICSIIVRAERGFGIIKILAREMLVSDDGRVLQYYILDAIII